jgi:hypothetical protein
MLDQLIRISQSTNKNLPGLSKTSIECAYDAYLVWAAAFDTDEWRAKQAEKEGDGKLDAVYFLDACPTVVDGGVEKPNPVPSPKIERTVLPEIFERWPHQSPQAIPRWRMGRF